MCMLVGILRSADVDRIVIHSHAQVKTYIAQYQEVRSLACHEMHAPLTQTQAPHVSTHYTRRLPPTPPPSSPIAALDRVAHGASPRRETSAHGQFL